MFDEFVTVCFPFLSLHFFIDSPFYVAFFFNALSRTHKISHNAFQNYLKKKASKLQLTSYFWKCLLAWRSFVLRKMFRRWFVDVCAYELKRCIVYLSYCRRFICLCAAQVTTRFFCLPQPFLVRFNNIWKQCSTHEK